MTRAQTAKRIALASMWISAAGWMIAPSARATLVCPPGTTDPAYCTDVAPVAITAAATAVRATGATLNGVAGPGVPAGDPTSYFFEWGLTHRYGMITSSRAVPRGAAAAPVSAVLRGLSPCTTYRFALVATNRDSTTIGRGQRFRTSFMRPVRSARIPRRAASGATVVLRLRLGWDARVRVFLKHGRRTVRTSDFHLVPHGQSVFSLRVPRSPGRYSIQIVARLACGRQQLTRRLLVSPSRARA